MTFCIVTHVPHGKNELSFFAYAPYVWEMNIWFKHTDRVTIVAPLNLKKKTDIEIDYLHDNISFVKVEGFNVLSVKSSIKALINLPKISIKIFMAMKNADHIHLRCPGNMGLIGCLIQILFPSKPKTAKYAGNWDMNAKQPFSYKIQKWILNNTFLTRNIKVLVYGEWENTSKNIKPFFTASYSENEKEPIAARHFDGDINFMFVGTLSNGKQPMYAIKLIEKLIDFNPNIRLSIFGHGLEKEKILNYIEEKKLNENIFLVGNKPKEEIKKEYQKNHFVILPSLSEGWPKVVAEGMFWGCLPVATQVSCVPNMLANEERGVLLSLNLNDDVQKLTALLLNINEYTKRVNKAVDWSRNYTLDSFENEIMKLLKA